MKISFVTRKNRYSTLLNEKYDFFLTKEHSKLTKKLVILTLVWFFDKSRERAKKLNK